jgi:hypothetical protein
MSSSRAAPANPGTLDVFGLHASSCNYYGSHTIRHNDLVDQIEKLAKASGLYKVSKERCIFKDVPPNSNIEQHSNQNTPALNREHWKKRMDLVISNVPKKDLDDIFVEKLSDHRKSQLSVGPHSQLLVDVTFFHPASYVSNVGSIFSDPNLDDTTKREKYFQHAAAPKYVKYGTPTLQRRMALTPIPVSSLGGFDDFGTNTIAYLIKSSANKAVRAKSSCKHVSVNELLQYHANFTRCQWRNVSTSIQKSLVRTIVNAFSAQHCLFSNQALQDTSISG